MRYERERPGELIHLETKKLGCIAGVGHRITGRRPGAVNRHHGIGREALHVCIDDASRLAYSEILPDEKKGERDRVSRPRTGVARQSGHQRRAGHDR